MLCMCFCFLARRYTPLSNFILGVLRRQAELARFHSLRIACSMFYDLFTSQTDPTLPWFENV